jgi:glucokinase
MPKGKRKKKASSSLVVGIDLGGTNMQIGVVNGKHKVLGRSRRKTEAAQGTDHVIDRLVEGVKKACDKADVSVRDLEALGIATAGAVDIPRGVVLDSPNLKWIDLPLREILEDRLGIPVVVDNDVNGAVWGEACLGAAKGAGDVLGAWIGTGVGGGIVLNGALYYGEFFTAGEIGHTILFPDGPENRRTVEHYCSRTGMARIIQEQLPAHPDSPVIEITEGTGFISGSGQFAKAVEMQCGLTIEVVNRGADLLGLALANCVTVLALDSIVLGGGVTEALGEPYVERVRASFKQHVFPDRCQACTIVATELKDDAGLLGAALLAQAKAEE